MTAALRKPPTRAACGICLTTGIIGGAVLFSIVGSITNHAVWGGVSGAAIGGLAGWGWCSGSVSSAVVWICCFAVAGAFIGPGCDADSLSSALWFGAVGAWIGYTGWRGIIALVGALIAVNIHPALFLPFVVVAATYFAGMFLERDRHRTGSHDFEVDNDTIQRTHDSMPM